MKKVRSDQRDSGFAAAAAVFAMVVIASLVAGGYFVASQQYRASTSTLQASSGLYAAEAGIQSALAQWDPIRVSEMDPGATIWVGSGRLANGDEYSVQLTRIDATQDGREAFYRLSSIGRPHGPRGGRRHIALFLRSEVPDFSCCEAALRTWGPVRADEGAMIRGLDSAPQGVVPGSCNATEMVDGDPEGVVVVRGRLQRLGTGGRIYGGVMAFNSDLDTVWIGGVGTLLSDSSCAVHRAAASSQLHIPHPLAERAWSEIFE